jgi:type VI secretion system secreted protein VgrG
MFKSPRFTTLVVLTAAVLAGAWPATAFAATQPRLGTALNFAAVAASTITNTNPTVITSNMALDPGSAVTGFPPGHVTGVTNISDAVALQAENDLTTAYTDAATAPTTSDMTGVDLGNQNLNPGVYRFSSSAQLTGPLTLSGNGVFIFQIGSTLTTASNSVVLLANGAQACSVWWQVGSSATLGSSTQFQGNLMALTSITMVSGANILTGRALARNGALTMDNNRISPPAGVCSLGTSSSNNGTSNGSSNTTNDSTTNQTGTPTTPSTPTTGAGLPGSLLHGLAVMSIGVLMVAVARRRSSRHSTSQS